MLGFLTVCKTPGYTSHDVVQYLRKNYQVKKVGHLGTLDPGAVGVLPLALGKATRFSQYILSQDKKYRFELTLGEATDTLDAQGKTIEKDEVQNTHIENLKNKYQELIGNINQVPPMYSAIKQKGKKLYELAREGKEVERTPRQVTIHSLNLVDIYEHQGKHRFLFDVHCSKGTYIRTLAEDLAKLSGTVGYMSFLIRTATGIFNLDDAIFPQELPEQKTDLGIHLFPVDYPLSDIPSLVLKESQQLKRFKNGNFVNTAVIAESGELYRIYEEDSSGDNLFLGLGKITSSNTLKPEKIIA
ncbi:tRNA pseudouridine(55) synthase TruB [Natranaerobius thermophilus]|uniref:tRNA pseudouridine synthase B n=1 Tax=Natranaerobius thermophilus (strain ATCC BAA-1301 / DSM 18059 / JW/NM-WN-LF) TaxID=457570 RepID=B2A3A0_NATTJ|nr:tRNA pseudouridine(55) synthase TruB [Natranaerobius thermophilus]ACB85030.1 tRNA pseudouridine synthase B [Natranaerobius thermophilus JW/NM-WN-LF]